MGAEDALYELAARLGSPVSFDRHGQVVWMDGFEEGIGKWLATVVGTDAAVALNGDYARNGAWCAKLTGGSDGSGYAMISRLLAFPLLGRMGFEYSFAFDGDLNVLELVFLLYDGTDLHRPVIRYDHPKKLLVYWDSGYGWVPIASGVDLFLSDLPFWTWKLVVDFGGEEYVHLVVNDKYYDLAGIAYPQVASEVNAHLLLIIRNYSLSGENGVVYIDDVIITQNEP